jgi:hypothetical protein
MLKWTFNEETFKVHDKKVRCRLLPPTHQKIFSWIFLDFPGYSVSRNQIRQSAGTQPRDG